MAAALPLSLYGCAGDKGAKREPLIVGGLPVTCNLTLPVACTAKAASIKAGHLVDVDPHRHDRGRALDRDETDAGLEGLRWPADPVP